MNSTLRTTQPDAKSYYSSQLTEKAQGVVFRIAILTTLLALLPLNALLVESQIGESLVWTSAYVSNIIRIIGFLSIILWAVFVREIVILGTYWMLAQTGKSPYYALVAVGVAILVGNALATTPHPPSTDQYFTIGWVFGAAIGLEIVGHGAVRERHFERFASWVVESAQDLKRGGA